MFSGWSSLGPLAFIYVLLATFLRKACVHFLWQLYYFRVWRLASQVGVQIFLVITKAQNTGVREFLPSESQKPSSSDTVDSDVAGKLKTKFCVPVGTGECWGW